MSSNISFRKIDCPEDYAAVYEYFERTDKCDMLFHNDRIKSYQEFADVFNRKLMHTIHVFFLLCADDGKIIGYAYSYLYRMFDSNCMICVRYMDDRYSSLLPEAIDKFCEYLYDFYPVKKMFVELLSSENDTIELFTGLGFTAECELNEYVFWGGKYQSLTILGKVFGGTDVD